MLASYAKAVFNSFALEQWTVLSSYRDEIAGSAQISPGVALGHILNAFALPHSRMAILVNSRQDNGVAAAVTALVHILLAIAWWPGNGSRGLATKETDVRGDGGQPTVVEFVAVNRAESSPEAKQSQPMREAITSAEQSEPVPYKPSSLDSLPSLPVNPEQPSTELVDHVVDSGSPGQIGLEGSRDDDLAARYRAALRAAIVSHWRRRAGKDLPTECAVRVDQEIGGRVLAVDAGDCPLASSEKHQLEAVVLMTQPLPYEGFETVFVSSLHLGL